MKKEMQLIIYIVIGLGLAAFAISELGHLGEKLPCAILAGLLVIGAWINLKKAYKEIHDCWKLWLAFKAWNERWKTIILRANTAKK